jgi:hypothetical protein
MDEYLRPALVAGPFSFGPKLSFLQLVKSLKYAAADPAGAI